MSDKVENREAASTRFLKFEPDLPEIRRPLRKLIAKSGFDVQEFLTNAELALKDVAADKKLEAPDPDFLFALSLLVDLNNWGRTIEIDESKMYVEVDESKLNKGKGRKVQQASEARKERLRQSMIQLRGAPASFEPEVGVVEANDVVENWSFDLVPVDRDSKYGDWFKSGITTWSMKYRSREGRSIRFVLTAFSGSREVP